jgi:hypothetical protein
MSREEVNDAFNFDGVDSEKKPELSLEKLKELKESKNKALPSKSNKSETALSFTAKRICRLGFQVNCLDFWSILLILISRGVALFWKGRWPLLVH